MPEVPRQQLWPREAGVETGPRRAGGEVGLAPSLSRPQPELLAAESEQLLAPRVGFNGAKTSNNYQSRISSQELNIGFEKNGWNSAKLWFTFKISGNAERFSVVTSVTARFGQPIEWQQVFHHWVLQQRLENWNWAACQICNKRCRPTETAECGDYGYRKRPADPNCLLQDPKDNETRRLLSLPSRTDNGKSPWSLNTLMQCLNSSLTK